MVSRLKKQKIRDIWKTEDKDFTPWLVQNIALPNEDGSFTCTLFMPYDNHEYAFNKLTDDKLVDEFFKNVFPDFHAMMPNLIEDWHMHPLSSLAIVRCYPWTHGKTALMGDSAHATVPFYGQGMNAGFEDCTVLWELMKKHNPSAVPLAESFIENAFAD